MVKITKYVIFDECSSLLWLSSSVIVAITWKTVALSVVLHGNSEDRLVLRRKVVLLQY